MDIRSFERRLSFVRRVLFAVLVFAFVSAGALAFIHIDEIYYARGVVRPAQEYSLYSLESGFVQACLADEGAAVKKGDLLYRLDTWDLEERKVALECERKELEAQLALQEKTIARVSETVVPQWLRFAPITISKADKAVEHRKTVLARYKKLADDGLLSELEYEKAKLELTQAESDLEVNQEMQDILDKGFVEKAIAESRAQAEVLRARIDAIASKQEFLQQEFARREIRAPEDGTVTLVLVGDPGEPMEKGQEMLRLSGSDDMNLDLFGGERNIHLVHEGQKVQFETEAFSSLMEGYCYATVLRVSTDSELTATHILDPSVAKASYYIQARVDKAPIPLKLGTTVDAEITLRRVPVFKVLLKLE
jgi:multidrug resistance efflux pump